ncbi:hypothetical protein DL771_001374 [Monosporascus sp. 5C6A]|nr:hypothetical protein DL771_001374 [Monosporascus sp. 5C6A]
MWFRFEPCYGNLERKRQHDTQGLTARSLAMLGFRILQSTAEFHGYGPRNALPTQANSPRLCSHTRITPSRPLRAGLKKRPEAWTAYVRPVWRVGLAEISRFPRTDTAAGRETRGKTCRGMVGIRLRSRHHQNPTRNLGGSKIALPREGTLGLLPLPPVVSPSRLALPDLRTPQP